MAIDVQGMLLHRRRARKFLLVSGAEEAAAAIPPFDDPTLPTIRNGYSVWRRLRAAYSGNLIEVEESGGNTLAEIGVDGDGNLDTAAYAAHVGANDGYLSKMMDQSSGATGATDIVFPVNQRPLLSEGGTLKTGANGTIGAIADGLLTNGDGGKFTDATFDQNCTMIAVLQPVTWIAGRGVLDGSSSFCTVQMWGAQDHYRIYAGADTPGRVVNMPTGEQHVLTAGFGVTDTLFMVDDGAPVAPTWDVGAQDPNGFAIGSFGVTLGNSASNVQIFEAFLFDGLLTELQADTFNTPLMTAHGIGGGGGGGGGGPAITYEEDITDNREANLLGYYPLEDPSGSSTALEVALSGLNGTITGTPAAFQTTSITGSDMAGAMQFDSDSRIQLEAIPGSDFRAANFTIACWFKRRGAGGTTTGGSGTPGSIEPLVTKGRGESETPGKNCNYFLGFIPGSGIGAFFEESAGAGVQILGGTAVANDEWHHAVFTYDGSNLNLYLDGASDATPVANSNGCDSASEQLACIAGALNSGGTNAGWWNGDIAHVTIHDAAISAADISDMYDAGVGPSPPTAALLTPASGEAVPTLPAIVIQLSPGTSAIDDATVVTGNVVLKRNGVTQTDTVDYTFSYAGGSDQITLTSIGGDFDAAYYEVVLNNIEGTDNEPIATDTTLTVSVAAMYAEWADGVQKGDLPTTTDWQEISGLAQPFLPANSKYIWAQGDGNRPFFLAIDTTDASSAGKHTLSGVTCSDNEDMASMQVSGTNYLYLGDFGDNANARASFDIYRVIEPTITGTDETVDAGDIEKINCIYDTGTPPSHKDAECLLVDTNGDMYIITKREAVPGVYKLAHQASYTGQQTFAYVGDMTDIPDVASPSASGNVVGGGISPDGSEIILKSYNVAYHFRRYPGETIFEALSKPLVEIKGYVGGGTLTSHPSQEPQGEALCFDYDGVHWYSASEYHASHGSPQGFPLYKYARQSVAATEVTLTSVLDTYLNQALPTTNYGTSASIVSDQNAGPSWRQPLIQWDLTGITSGDTILGAYANIYVNTEGQGWQIHEMLRTWNESTTFTSFAGNGPQGEVGRDDVDAASTFICDTGRNLDTETGTFRNNGFVALCQKWLDNSAVNFGTLWHPSHVSDGQQFDSREGTNAPELVIRHATLNSAFDSSVNAVQTN